MSNLADRITYYLVEKTEQVYGRVERRFNIERVDELPHDWLADTSHSVPHCNIGVAFTNPADAMHEVARLYREALLADADVQLEIWVDKDAPDGYAPPIAGLYACRGFATLSFIHELGGDNPLLRCLQGVRGRRQDRRDAGRIGGRTDLGSAACRDAGTDRCLARAPAPIPGP